MNDEGGVKFCPECGTRLSRGAKFCVSCGTRQEEPASPPVSEAPAARPERPAPAPPPPPEPAAEQPEPPEPAPGPPAPAAEPPAPEPEPPAPEPEPAAAQEPPAPEPEPGEPRRPPLEERVGRFDADAGELVGQVAAALTVPAVVAAGGTALVAALAVFASGLVLAAVFPDESLIGAVGQGAGFLSEAFRQIPQLVSASVFSAGLFDAGPTRAAPLVLVAIPIAACALAARAQRGRIDEVTGVWRLAWAAGTGLLFALLLVVLTLFGGEGDGVEPSLGSVFGLGLVWGTLGVLAGAPPHTAARQDPRLETTLAVARDALRPLAAVLTVCALLGLWGWLVQTARDVGNLQGSRSEALALVENGLYVAEHGIHFTELGALVQFEQPGLGALGLPFPVEDPSEVASPGEDFRIFAYREPLPAYVFVPGMLLLISLPLLAALYAGFLVARRRGASDLARGAGWGALVGPVWAVVLGLLSALAGKRLFGDPASGSAFATFLLGGALLGALGGVLAARAGESVTSRPAAAA